MDYSTPETAGFGTIILLSVLSLIATLAVILRFWARRIQKIGFELNDYLIVLGLVFSIADFSVTSFGIVFFRSAMSESQADNPETILKAKTMDLKLIFICPLIWVISVSFTRASIISLYIRIFRTRKFLIACYVILAINAFFFIGTVLADCLICRPITFRWSYGTGGICGDQQSLDYFIGVFNLLMDITVVVMPMPVLWGLQMAVGKKAVLSVMFGMGIGICVVTFCRIYITTTINGSNREAVYFKIGLLANLEALFGVINACLPTMRPVFNKLRSASIWSGKSTTMFGSIPIAMRISQMWTLSRRGSSANGSSPTDLRDLANDNEYERLNSPQWMAGGVTGRNQDSLGEAKKTAMAIHVLEDVDVERANIQD
ncbi:hypothetical protein MMC28_008057 [Mycoblastus sanguinarius]|nr:hypothetical protein [Mycoblastus sanguinarius]